MARHHPAGAGVEPPSELAPESPESTTRTELVMYGVAVVGLIGLGIWLTTPILNWIVGPAFVVAVVTLGTPAVERLRRRRQR